MATRVKNGIEDPDLRARVDKEMQELTEIGNTFMIRHTEVGKKPITSSQDAADVAGATGAAGQRGSQ